MKCAETHGHPVANRVCDIHPASISKNDVYVNALADEMPACDRLHDTVNLNALDHADTCFVYCAQRSCQAANEFMEKNAKELRHKCDDIVYLHNGALSMPANELKDGMKCHADIIEFNRKHKENDGCLSCQGNTSIPVDVEIDGQATTGEFLRTDDAIPDWYIQNGIYSPLPPQFTCDGRYKHPVQPHAKGSSLLKVMLPKEEPRNSTIAFWAAKPAREIKEAHAAYDTFENAGIVQCVEHVCEIPLDLPGSYTADGKVFPRHLHYTEWAGDRWNMTARTINF